MTTTARGIACQIVFESVTGMPEDRATWTLHFQRSTDASYDDVKSPLSSMILASVVSRTWTGFAPDPVGKFVSKSMSRDTDAVTVKLYDMDLPTGERSPYTRAGTLPSAPEGGSLPEECAVVLSNYSQSDPDVAIERSHRGRTYIGPLSVVASSQPSGDRVYVATSVINACAGFARSLNAIKTEGITGLPANSVGWCVYSRKDNTLRAVTNVFIDNAFDTQRRRGPAPTTRYRYKLADF